MRPPTLGNTVLEALIAFRQFLVALLGWLIAYPLTRIVQRDPNLILVIARPGFSDNSKYFYLYAAEQLAGHSQVVLLTADSAIRRQIIDAGGKAIAHPSPQSLYLLLHCGTVATDVSSWFDYGAYPLTCGATRVQMWHGAPLKHIEQALFKQRLSRLPAWLRPLLQIQKAVIGRYPRYDLVVATSKDFIRDAFAQSFSAKQFVATGYPRNDILFGWPPTHTLAYRLAAINIDHETLRRASEAHESGLTVCLYVPTFRKDMGCSFEGAVNLERLSRFAGQHRLLIVLKLHPFLHGMHALREYPHLIEYDAQSDVYPLMPLADVLITDYSSIFFDFLLLDRPILFLTHDLEQYLEQDRAMYFDFESMTPGVKCPTQDKLEQALLSILESQKQDDQAANREQIRIYTHDWRNRNSAQRLMTACIRCSN
jgi:CDP-glycerol glycerophosphotransferase